jgi:hypothetical protein
VANIHLRLYFFKENEMKNLILIALIMFGAIASASDICFQKATEIANNQLDKELIARDLPTSGFGVELTQINSGRRGIISYVATAPVWDTHKYGYSYSYEASIRLEVSLDCKLRSSSTTLLVTNIEPPADEPIGSSCSTEVAISCEAGYVDRCSRFPNVEEGLHACVPNVPATL